MESPNNSHYFGILSIYSSQFYVQLMSCERQVSSRLQCLHDTCAASLQQIQAVFAIEIEHFKQVTSGHKLKLEMRKSAGNMNIPGVAY